ncbi:MAG: diacylglycerol kinase family lipid kinase [Thermodesulfovibrionales bacterium]|nr:diacylglycerol kinase family lipid kinase [Thermodesulfovibrionales bacterium]
MENISLKINIMLLYRKIVIIANPLAGKGSLISLDDAKRILINKGYDVIIKETSYKGHGEEIAREISLNESYQEDTLVISAGGDGTYNEVANGLVYSNVPMAVLPLGTTSVLARELSIPFKIDDAIKTILEGTVVDVNIGSIELLSNNKKRFFLLMAGIGFDGETVKNVDIKLKRYIGQLAYIFSGLKTLFRYKSENFTIYIDGQESITCSNIIICKSARYGGSFIITPDASLLSPSFSCFATKGSRREILIKYILGIITGQHLRLKGIKYFTAKDLIITGKGHVQIDGDYIGSLPVKISIAQKALRLVVSQYFLAKTR